MERKFVIHEHHARRLHFDLRLEMSGVLKSWAVPKGPSLDPAEKRLAVAVPDHSLSYGDFEGTLAEGTYGAGEVRIWDDGTYETKGDPILQYEKGKIVFTVFGLKIRGEFALVKMRGKGEDNWLLIKADDRYADPSWTLKTVL
jgi:bifunctional non-homologous end joining protein LigD